MNKDDQIISDEIKRLSNSKLLQRLMQTGTVVSVDEVKMECKVQLTSDMADMPTDAILLNVIVACINGVYIIPAENADCIVLLVDGHYELWKASHVTKVVVAIENTKFTMSSEGVKIEANGKNLGTVMQDFIQHVEDLVLDTPSGTGSVDIISKNQLIEDATNFNLILL